jgi:hypothetical protein
MFLGIIGAISFAISGTVLFRAGVMYTGGRRESIIAVTVGTIMLYIGIKLGGMVFGI